MAYKYKFQSQERQDELGLNWDSFKWRNYDYAIGRFMCIDPLSEDYTYQSPYNFAENKVISHIEMEGLEGIHSSKVDAAGNRTHIIEKNVIVLTHAPRPVNAGASPKQQARIERQNQRIAKANVEKINNTKDQLKNSFGGAKNSAGESVEFKFNVKGMEVNNTDGGKNRELTKLALENGIVSSEKLFDGNGPNKISPAAIITTGPSSALGDTNGVKINIGPNSPDGTVSHEIGHTLMTDENTKAKEDSYPNGNGSLMDSPPGKVSSSEVDRMIDDSYEK